MAFDLAHGVLKRYLWRRTSTHRAFVGLFEMGGQLVRELRRTNRDHTEILADDLLPIRPFETP